MTQPSPATVFNEHHAAEYDTRFAKAAAMKDALHLLTAAVLGELPADARVLSVGAGTGAEVIDLARRFSARLKPGTSHPVYCSSATCSIHSTTLPSSSS